MNEPPTCARCEDEYSLRDGMEPSKYCDPCAQEIVSELEAMLAAELQRCRDVITEIARIADPMTPGMTMPERLMKIQELSVPKGERPWQSIMKPSE